MGNERNKLSNLVNRVTTLERSARRWRMAFVALAVAVVGVAADSAVKDATFGTVKATTFEVVDSKRKIIGSLSVAKSKGEEFAGIMLRNASGTEWSVLTAGGELKTIHRPATDE